MSDPSFVQGLSNLGVLLRTNGRWSEALAVQELAVSELRALAAARRPARTSRTSPRPCPTRR